MNRNKNDDLRCHSICTMQKRFVPASTTFFSGSAGGIQPLRRMVFFKSSKTKKGGKQIHSLTLDGTTLWTGQGDATDFDGPYVLHNVVHRRIFSNFRVQKDALEACRTSA